MNDQTRSLVISNKTLNTIYRSNTSTSPKKYPKVDAMEVVGDLVVVVGIGIATVGGEGDKEGM